MTIVTLPTLDATNTFGRHLGEHARPGDIVTLSGELGAGKTALTQAIGQGLGIPENCYITSPTFSLLHEYQGRIPLYHLDLYRLSGEEEIEELGIREILYGGGLCVIEWPDRFGSLVPAERLEVQLLILTPESRQLKLTAHGSRWKKRLALLVE